MRSIALLDVTTKRGGSAQLDRSHDAMLRVLQFFSTLEPLRTRRAFLRYLAPLRGAKWVVYSKAPFDGPEQVLGYVSRYTHRVAISNVSCSTSRTGG